MKNKSVFGVACCLKICHRSCGLLKLTRNYHQLWAQILLLYNQTWMNSASLKPQVHVRRMLILKPWYADRGIPSETCLAKFFVFPPHAYSYSEHKYAFACTCAGIFIFSLSGMQTSLGDYSGTDKTGQESAHSCTAV